MRIKPSPMTEDEKLAEQYKDLLIYAARAAGYRRDPNYDVSSNGKRTRMVFGLWQPFDSDADAFRLMVDLKIDLQWDHRKKSVYAMSRSVSWIEQSFEEMDRYEAARLVIVTVASIMGTMI